MLLFNLYTVFIWICALRSSFFLLHTDMHIYRVRNETFCFSHGDCLMHRVTQLGSIIKWCWCYFYLKDSESRLDGDLSEPRTGVGVLWYTYITCQTLLLGWFFLADLQKLMVRWCTLWSCSFQRGGTDMFGQRDKLGRGQALLVWLSHSFLSLSLGDVPTWLKYCWLPHAPVICIHCPPPPPPPHTYRDNDFSLFRALV